MILCCCRIVSSVFFFNDTATTEIYTLSLHDALPIYRRPAVRPGPHRPRDPAGDRRGVDLRQPHRHGPPHADRKSTRLNSSHANISYAVFCLKKKKQTYSTYSESSHTVNMPMICT